MPIVLCTSKQALIRYLIINVLKEALMTPRRIVTIWMSTVFALSSVLVATGQSPNNTSPSRGKNGSTQAQKMDGVKDGGNGVKPESVRLPRIQTIRQDVGNSIGEGTDNIKLAVDLVVLDAQVLQQKTGRVIGNLRKEDFVLAEDGIRQEITQFSQDTLPLSVILLIDRGGCLDPFSEKVRHATLEALQRLRPQDEVALMAFHNTTDLIEGFGRGKDRILAALNRIPPHDEEAGHCFNEAFYDAANYMRRRKPGWPPRDNNDHGHHRQLRLRGNLFRQSAHGRAGVGKRCVRNHTKDRGSTAREWNYDRRCGPRRRV